MEIKDIVPRKGEDRLRLGDGDELVVIEKYGMLPQGEFCINTHSIVVICTAGMAQFDYDGHQIQLRKNDLFLYMAKSVVSNFMSSTDFCCRQIWFSRGELWNINLYGDTRLADLTYLKQHPKVHLNDDDVALLDEYFLLLCRRMRDTSPLLHLDIVRSLVSTMMLEMLAIFRREAQAYFSPAQFAPSLTSPEGEGEAGTDDALTNGKGQGEGSFHRRRLAEQFIQLVEQSDGRSRSVAVFASQLNITPKYLSTILKETMNRRPSQIIHFFTFRAIEQRLRFTDMTMQEIANDLNFANASFFGKYFKEHAGMTPLAFRKKYQK